MSERSAAWKKISEFCEILSDYDQISKTFSRYSNIFQIFDFKKSYHLCIDMLRDSQRGAFLSRNTLSSSGKSLFGSPKVEKDDGKIEIENLLYSFNLNPCGKVDF